MGSGRVIVVGSVNLDVMYRVPHLPGPGETLLGSQLERRSGGKGGNQAHAAAKSARAGIPVAMVACVGDDDAGVLLRAELAAAGVDVSGVTTVPAPSGTALIAVDPAGENTIVVVPGANSAWSDAALAAFVPRATDVVVLQLEVPFAVVETVVSRAAAVGARVVLNAAPMDRRITDLLTGVDVLVVNEPEAAALFELTGAVGPEVVAEVAAGLPCDLVVTLGARGALLAPAGGSVSVVPAFAVDAVDTVGAGDAFVGGLAVALVGGASLTTAVRWGAAAGALTATVFGARHPGLDPASVEALAGPIG